MIFFLILAGSTKSRWVLKQNGPSAWNFTFFPWLQLVAYL